MRLELITAGLVGAGVTLGLVAVLAQTPSTQGPTVEQMRKAVASLVRSYERVDTFIVIRTDPGQANGLAVLMDRVKVPEVAGTVAGDDTILLVCRGLENAIQMEQKLSAMVKGTSS